MLWVVALALAIVLPFVITHATRKHTSNAGDTVPVTTSSSPPTTPASSHAPTTSSHPATTPATTTAPTTKASTAPTTTPPAVVSTPTTSTTPSTAPTATPTPSAGPPSTGTTNTSPASGGTRTAETYTVRAGDTMWSITKARIGPGATNAQIVALWPQYYAQNTATVGGNPNLLRPGEVLHLTG